MRNLLKLFSNLEWLLACFIYILFYSALQLVLYVHEGPNYQHWANSARKIVLWYISTPQRAPGWDLPQDSVKPLLPWNIHYEKWVYSFHSSKYIINPYGLNYFTIFPKKYQLPRFQFLQQVNLTFQFLQQIVNVSLLESILKRVLIF